jgi:hypothetical protein
MVGNGDGYATGRGGDGLNAKDNFEFERAVGYREEGSRKE